jgi:release factor glutamine methyltransferase|tara:strand:- start:766 stop:1614 length:849 start_codon:yes stop_codon:yes gene_type:complete
MVSKIAFQNLHNALQTIYDNREAFTISTYIFEDIFKIYNTQSEKTLSKSQVTQLDEIQNRLLKYEPWQHIVGFADFYGSKFHVSPDVLVPRPETEELVQLILDHVKPMQTVLDIGTGSGCIPISIKKKYEHLMVFGLDVSEAALEIARKNAELNQVEINWRQADILNPKEWSRVGANQKFDIIVSNPPYVLESDKSKMHQNVLEFDPELALFVADETPLLFYDAIADFALQYLNANGQLYFEIHQDFGQQTVALLEKKGFTEVKLVKDLFGNDRIVAGNIYT